MNLKELVIKETESPDDIKTFKRRRDGQEYSGYVIRRTKFSGFIAHFKDGETVKEKDVRRADTGSISTNWHDFDKSKLVSLELVNKSSTVAIYSKKDYPDIQPEDWYFACEGFVDPKVGVTRIIGRKIGIRNNGMLSYTRVLVDTGLVRGGVRKSSEG